MKNEWNKVVFVVNSFGCILHETRDISTWLLILHLYVLHQGNQNMSIEYIWKTKHNIQYVHTSCYIAALKLVFQWIDKIKDMIKRRQKIVGLATKIVHHILTYSVFESKRNSCTWRESHKVNIWIIVPTIWRNVMCVQIMSLWVRLESEKYMFPGEYHLKPF